MKKFNDEFRGFFFADGCASIVKLNRNYTYTGKRVGEVTRKYITYSARLQITQRDDNLQFLEKIKELYGGAIYRTKSPINSNPTATWVVERTDIVHKLCKELLKANFSYRSIDAIKSLYEYCDWRLKRGLQSKYKYNDIKKIEEWRYRITQTHKY